MRGVSGSVPKLQQLSPERLKHDRARGAWRQRSTQSLKFKKIERAVTQTTLPVLELSPARRPTKTLQSILSNNDRIDRMRRRERQNLQLLDSYLANYHVKKPAPPPPAKRSSVNNLDKCYTRDKLSSALDGLLQHRDLLSGLNDSFLHIKVRNTLKAFSCYPLLMQFLSDLCPAEELLEIIYGEGEINYDMAREVVKVNQAVKKCISLHQENTLTGLHHQIRKQHDSVIDLFNKLNLKLARKSTDYHHKLMLLDTLKKIDLHQRSFLQTEAAGKQVVDRRLPSDRVGQFERINPLVLNHSRLLHEQSTKLRHAFS